MRIFKNTNTTSPQVLQRFLHVAAGGLSIAFLISIISSKSFISRFPSAQHTEYNTQNLSIPLANLEMPLSETEALQQDALRDRNNSLLDNITADAPLQTPSANPSWLTVNVLPGDSLAKIFQRIGASKKSLQEILNSDPKAHKFKSLKPGQAFKYRCGNNQLEELLFETSPENMLMVKLVDNHYEFKQKNKEISNQINFATGEIRDSLFNSAKLAGLDNKLINQIVSIFGWDIDFALDIRRKDTFKVLFEEKFLEGKKLENGPILAVEFINQGKKYQAVRFTDKSGRTGYFTPAGQGLHKAFLRTPVKFTHISSYFGNRTHPVLHRIRHHKGVDYAAPTGTPVKATGDAKVVFAGQKSGYGKVIVLQHGSKYSTLYAHLSKFAQNLQVGNFIDQGQVIGYVGASGLATGPHLHYEFLDDGVHRDPLKVTLPKVHLVDNLHKREFLVHAKKMLQLMEQTQNNIKVATKN